ncbi:MAG: mercuric reductase [bacterium]
MSTGVAHYDAIVIGAGQGGGPLAGAFAKAGLRTLIVERSHVGGTCINEGCTPTKTMIASGRVAYLARRATDYGVLTGTIAVDLAAVRDRKRRIVDSFRGGSERALERAGVELRMGAARFTGPRAIAIETADGVASAATAEVIVINTGLRPQSPNIQGLPDVPSLDSTSIMELDEIPPHLIVLGGGYVGVEFAQLFRRLGSAVTLVHRGAQLLAREDSDIAEAIAYVLRQDDIDIWLKTTTTQAAHTAAGGVTLNVRSADGRTAEISGSHLLVATGRRPNTDGLDTQTAGVALDKDGYVVVNQRLETSAPGVYAIGDVNRGPAFTHIAYDDFRILRTNLLNHGHASTEGRVLPYTVFTDPQLGRVGLTEAEARAAGFDVQVASMPMSSVARALETDESRGIMKAVVDRATRKILGAAVLGIEGGEIASLIQVAMMGGLPFTSLRDGVFSHPTLAESLNNLFKGLTDE